jgi:hypothetical protein
MIIALIISVALNFMFVAGVLWLLCGDAPAGDADPFADPGEGMTAG